MDDIIQARDTNLATVLILLDYTRAFDMIDHKTIAILKLIGFEEGALSLLASFLADRHQTVQIADKASETLPVLTGLLQNSILRPLLYSFYTVIIKMTSSFFSHKYHINNKHEQTKQVCIMLGTR